MSDSPETYCAVVYTDGTKFINPRGFGRVKNVINLPKAKFDPNDNEDKLMQATLALFNQTSIRVKPIELKSLGIFSSDDNFNIDVYYLKVAELPLLSNLKCNEYFIPLGGDLDIRISSIEGYSYIDFADLENSDYIYTLKGMKNVLYQINQHFEEGIKWEDIA